MTLTRNQRIVTPITSLLAGVLAWRLLEPWFGMIVSIGIAAAFVGITVMIMTLVWEHQAKSRS